MAMESKVDFLRSAETALAEVVTASDMKKIMRTLADVLEGYERNEVACRQALKRDAKNAIRTLMARLEKEQEPRVMTLEEVKAFGWDYCYLEEERLPGKEYRSVCGDYALTCITWPCIASMRLQHGDDSYGKKWRCWSAKPTDKQRQKVKWG